MGAHDEDCGVLVCCGEGGPGGEGTEEDDLGGGEEFTPEWTHDDLAGFGKCVHVGLGYVSSAHRRSFGAKGGQGTYIA